MENEKLKLKPNEWMICEKFLSRIDYHNKYYIENLGKKLYSYIETIPIPIITTWDPVHKRIYILVGQDKRFFELDEHVSYYDFVYLIDKWLSKFFPRFCVEEEIDDVLDDDKIYEKVKEGMKLDDVLLIKEKKKIKDIGIITRIEITNDEFNLLRNGKEFVRITGSLDNLMPLSLFLKELRNITNDEEKRNFILTNSRELKQLNNSETQIVIDYPAKMMLNFFVIQYQELKNVPIVKIIEGLYEWDKFKISFETKELERDCLRYVKQAREEDNIVLEEN